MSKATLNGDVWLIFRGDHFYPIEVSDKCTPEAHAKLNSDTTKIMDAKNGNILWERSVQ